MIAFIALFTLMQGGHQALRGGAFDHLFIDQLTVRSAAALIDIGWPGVGVVADGSRLRAPGGGLNVLNGCEGLDVVFLLTAAMLAAPAGWRARLIGLALGWPLVFALNQLRIVALFHAFRHDRDWFDLLHGGLAPLGLVLMAGLFFVVWLERSRV